MTISSGNKTYLPFAINETDTLAGTAQELIAPVSGYLVGLDVIVQKAVTTGGAITVEIATVAVAGLSVTVADAAAKGTMYSDVATKGSATRKVTKGQRITVTPAAAFATAGAVSGFLTIDSSVKGEEAL